MMPPLSRARHCETTPCPTPSSREGGLRLGGRALRGRYGSLAPCCLPAPWRLRLRRHALHRCCPTATVSPGSGTTATVFTFSVDYNSSNPVRNATAVWAEFGAVTITLALASGNTHAGTWVGHLDASSWHPAGDLPRIDLGEPSTRSAQRTDRQRDVAATDAYACTHATAHPRPTPRPTAAPTPTPRPARRQPLEYRRPEARRVPLPQVRSRRHRPATMTIPRPRRVPRRRPVARATSSQALPVATRRETPDEDSAPIESPQASDATDEDEANPRGSMLAPLLFVGGTMSLVGAAVLGRQWFVTRRRPDP